MKFSVFSFFILCWLFTAEVFAAEEDADELWERERERRRALETLQALAESLNGLPRTPVMNQVLMIPEGKSSEQGDSTQR